MEEFERNLLTKRLQAGIYRAGVRMSPGPPVLAYARTEKQTLAREFSHTRQTVMLVPNAAALRRKCDLSTLTLTSGSFIEDDLLSYCSDVLYSLRTTSGDGYVYCLIEHQSSPDRHMAVRLLRYAVAAMHRHLADDNDQLPLVIPLLFCHGQVSLYPYTLCWLGLFSDRALAEKLYTHGFPLADVTVIPDDDIMQHRRVAVLELIQKHIRLRDLAELAAPLVTLFRRVTLKKRCWCR